MQIARVKAKCNLPARRCEHCGLIVIDPVAGQRPFVEVEVNRKSVKGCIVPLEAAWRCKILCALVAYIGFRRLHFVISGAASAPCALTLTIPPGSDCSPGRSFRSS